MNDTTRFINEQLYPLMWDRIGQIFPEFQRLNSHEWGSPLKLDGSEPKHPRKDKTYIDRKYYPKVNENGGDSVSLLDYYMQRNSLNKNSKEDIYEAVKQIANIVGVEVPSFDVEAYKAYKERTNLLESCLLTMQSNLETEQGKEVLNYLQRPKAEGGREYSLELVKSMRLGVITPDVEKDLYKAGLLGYEAKDKESPNWYSKNYPLVTPFISGGTIYGFKFRSIKTDEERGKLAKYQNTKDLPKKEKLYGLSNLPAQSLSKRDSNLTIVEGEFDSLHAQIAGIDNIVAVAGGAGAILSKEQIETIKEKHYNYITLLMDSDKAGRDFVNRAVPVLGESGLSIFIATLPEGDWKDTDEYLLQHTGEELQTIIEKAVPLPVYEFYRYAEEYKAKQDNGNTTEKDFVTFRRNIIDLFSGISYSSKDGKEYTLKVTPTDIDRLTTEFNLCFSGQYITAESIKAEAQILRAKREEAKQVKEAQKLASKIEEAVKYGSMQDFFKLLDESKKIKEIAQESKYSSLLNLYTLDDVQREIEADKIGIQTEYKFKRITKKGKEEEDLILPSGAVSFICAGTSHGKSKMLQNLALQAVNNEGEGTVLYFSYEEERSKVLLQFLNIYADIELNNRNSLRTLQDYIKMKDKEPEYLLHYTELKPEVIKKFTKAEAEFNQILKDGRLRVFYEDFSAQSLIGAIQYIKRTQPVKAVFIDYMQLLTLEGSELTLREELKQIGIDLKNLAVKEKLPIVVAAQLKREADSPTKMISQQIAESADIERIANIVLCIWNSSFSAVDEVKEAGQLESHGFTAGVAGTIYAVLSKNREGTPALESVLDFKGNTGRITQREYNLPIGF